MNEPRDIRTFTTDKPLMAISGLKRLAPDKRDYSHAKTFGSANLFELPSEYLLVTTILNQGITPYCTAYSACAVREAQAGVQFDTNYFYEKEGEVNGKPSSDGYDLRVEMKTGLAGGFKPTQGDVVNKKPEDFNEESFFSIDGPNDLFDNIRSAMWLAKEEKRCVVIGTMMYREWLFASPGGVVKESYGGPLSPNGLHAMKVAGWKTINGVLYLVCQNSYGPAYGDGGLFYFPRAVVNKEFVEGSFAWRAKAQGTIKTIDISFWQIALKKIAIALYDIAAKLGFQ